jgi:glycosyltransferase involved in cell wall biosynthesis
MGMGKSISNSISKSSMPTTVNEAVEHASSSQRHYDIICLSHLRWDFVYQRPQHLLSRFARSGARVFFVEEPVFTDDGVPHLHVSPRENGLFVIMPHISHADREKGDVSRIQRELLDEMLVSYSISTFVTWFYTPMAMDYAAQLPALVTVFDCMDELSAFKFAPPELLENEQRLLEKADVVFTGGQSLYEAKKGKSKHVYAFPSSVEVEHFRQARTPQPEPKDQEPIPHPRLGYYGVIDERIALGLLRDAAQMRPDWHFVMVGPVVKISEDDLPRAANIHYLGGKTYQELPQYLATWELALMPFAINESTRYISPTKTPEYLAGGKPVVSTPIRDVVRPYGEMNLVHIASTAEEFVMACETALREQPEAGKHWEQIDTFLAQNSWDATWTQMAALIDEAIVRKPGLSASIV